MSNGPRGVLEVDPAELRVAASRMDRVFTEANTALTNTDREISSSSAAWTGTAVAAFAQFDTYVNDRRTALLAGIARLSDTLTANANGYEGQEATNTAAISELETS